ncbi:MAG: EAL domain-containing protein [Deltaproteobacteria bacterium]|nr:EAL domain-containing protein [Deltaproteobacteria bacterium]
MALPATLLIVDDDDGVRALLDSALRDVEATRALHADMLSAQKYVEDGGRVDVALVDKNLPDGTGAQFIGWLRQHVPAAEAVLMTAQTSIDSAVEAMKAGACDYVRKPFDDLSQLRMRVCDALEKVALKRSQTLLMEKLWHEALHDPLTGLANRTAFLDRLRTSLDELRRNPDRLYAVLFIDIDRFKHVNDNLGHQEGDKLIATIGQRIAAAVRETDVVARLDGDEFTVLLREIEQPTDAARVAERIHQSFTEPIRVGGREIFTTCSIGAALSNDPRDPDSASSVAFAEAMLRNADLAMYRAKRGGKSATHFFDAEMQARAQRSWQLESSLHEALKNGEISVAYQPIMALPERRLAGFEALVRWRSPTLGQVAPLELVAIAEECGLIDAVFEHVLDTAVHQLRAWQQQLGESALSMSVNLSSKQLSGAHFVERVLAHLHAAEVPASALELEITESALMDDPERARGILEGLRDAGVRLSIDDFGTGYSSLSHLSRLPVSSLKIDRSFVMDAAAANIVGFVVDLARHLHLHVVAEGVEKEMELESLLAHGCGFAQGYYFSKPLAADAMSAWLATRR